MLKRAIISATILVLSGCGGATPENEATTSSTGSEVSGGSIESFGIPPERILAFELSGLRLEMTIEEAKTILANEGWIGEIGFYTPEETFQDIGRTVTKGEDMLAITAYRDAEGVARVLAIALSQRFDTVQNLTTWETELIERYGQPSESTLPQSSDPFGQYFMTWEVYDGNGDGRQGAAWAEENIPNYWCWRSVAIDKLLDACGGSRESLMREIRKTSFITDLGLFFSINQSSAEGDYPRVNISLQSNALRLANDTYADLARQLNAYEAAQ